MIHYSGGRLFIREPQTRMWRPPPQKPLRNTDDEVDCSPMHHIMYRPICQTVRLDRRRPRREKRRRLPTIVENLCMFEWLHRTEAYKEMTNEELQFVLLNGLFHQNKNNVAIVINRDQKTGKTATSQMDATFGKAESRAEALKVLKAAYNSARVPLEVPASLKAIPVAHVDPTSECELPAPSEPSTSCSPTPCCSSSSGIYPKMSRAHNTPVEPEIITLN
ncbi:unnamed protein product [Caenorhabditis sp. 36 PRJEB53466]|nr:unnamed protein product [Caenorhabditis sp. 36 PRJEB53466]